MHPAYQAPSSPPPSFRQSKVDMQRQYREKEGECINTLRDIIKALTGEELQTRKEILRKAIDLLSAVSEIRGQLREAQAVPPAPCEISGAAHLGNFTQSSHGPQTWQFNINTEPNAPGAYYTALLDDNLLISKGWSGETNTTQSHGQQYHIMSSMDFALAQAFLPPQ